MKRSLSGSIARALVTVWFVARSVAAVCQCPAMTLDEQKEQATYIFVGTVDDVKGDKGPNQKITFDLDDVFKGEPHSQVEVVDAGVGTDCAFDFKENDPYTVYAHWEWGTLTVSSCTGT